MNKDELCKSIEKSFSGIPYPGDDDLTVHPLGLDESFYEAIKGKAHYEVGHQTFNEHNDCIGVLTPKGFQYYLPGFLITDLTLEMSAIFGQLTYWLSECQDSEHSPIIDMSGKEWLNPRIEILANDQKNALIKYFEFYKNNNLIEEELSDVHKIIDFIYSKLEQEE